MPTCTTCATEKPEGDFYVQRGRFTTRCRGCTYIVHRKRLADPARKAAEAEYQRAYREGTREKRLAYGRAASRRRFLANRELYRHYVRQRRARLYGQELPSLRAVLERIAQCGGKCVYCDGPNESIDHVMPPSVGGSNELRNLVPACRRCNTSKQRRDWRAWLRGQPTWSAEREAHITRLLAPAQEPPAPTRPRSSAA